MEPIREERLETEPYYTWKILDISGKIVNISVTEPPPLTSTSQVFEIPAVEPDPQPMIIQETKKRKSATIRRKDITATKPTKHKVFRTSWLEQSDYKDWLQPVKDDPTLAYCACCEKSFGAGKSEIDKHSVGVKHVANLKSLQIKEYLIDSTKETDSENELRKKQLDSQVKIAVIKMKSFFVDHNFNNLTANHFMKMMKEIFPDSEIAQHMHADRSK